MSLLLNIKKSVSRIRSDSGKVAPVSPVACAIIVDQHLLEVSGTQAPIHALVFDEKTRDILPATVGHPTGGFQLEHIGVDKVDAGLGIPPLLQ